MKLPETGKFARKVCKTGVSGMGEFGRATDLEGLRLMSAFFKIADPAQRLELIRVAEQLGREPVEPPPDVRNFCQDKEPGV
jgi:hypothetical protein